MERSALYLLVQSFSVVERREIRKFLLSPFYNQRQDLVQLYDTLCSEQAEVGKQAYWVILFGDADYDDQKMRLLMSYLHRLIEQYMGVKEMGQDPFTRELYLAKAYRQRKMHDQFERVRRDLHRDMDAAPLRDLAYYQHKYQLDWEAFQLSFVQNPTEVSALHLLSEQADTAYLIQKLRILCLLAAHQAVYKSGEMPDWASATVALAEVQGRNIPAIQVYLQCHRMLLDPATESHFKTFKKMLLEEAHRFSAADVHGLYIWALNYCVRRLNAGDLAYYAEALEMYQAGLAKGYLLEDGLLSRFTYHNIVAAGLHTGALAWVRQFIQEYRPRLDKKYRESSFSFNLARLEYAEQRYEAVLGLLQTANYRDPLLNLAAKTLLLKIYYETNEWDLLQSHLDAMRNYVHRKHVIGYHRNNYLNLIRYTDRLMRINLQDRSACNQLLESILQEKELSEKAFFKKILSGGET
jgi:hypothetical protein